MEVKNLHRDFAKTTIFIRHDQDEALTLSGCIVVIRDGRIEQIDTPDGLHDKPATRFVAIFWASQLLKGNAFNVDPDAPDTVVMLRPERVCIAAPGGSKLSDANQHQFVEDKVEDMIFAGPLRKYQMRVGRN
ncbi:hypothetical protein ML401_37795 (plasmid) [Bradyrhizobium sp. 62B]|uniref:hypothetical protein n=1 Tax=Bradyrhizobium sp. 62B TaxID=2898442 RepID=UPI002557C971|nr:hypothetical protein ML401_37795 [Bradyrhizobium sp. 62B]